MAWREAGVKRLRAAACLGCLAAAAVILAGPASAPAAPELDPPGRGAPAVTDEIIVGFHAGVADGQSAAALDAAGATKRRSFGRIRAALVVARPGRREEALEKLLADPRVRYAEPNTLVHALDHGSTPNDPFFHDLWALRNFGQTVNGLAGAVDADVDAVEAWGAGSGGEVLVGVIDTGIDFSHPDLGGGDGARPMWTNPGETCPGCETNGQDDDENGYVDDWRGWDFVNDDGNPMDDHGHGTHVAGTIGAIGDNGIGVAGVAPNVRLMALKFLGADGSGTNADAVAALLYAVAAGARITSNSWGNADYSQAMADALAVADGAGSLFVAAAGNSLGNNDVTPNYPSSYPHPNVLAVAATDQADAKAWFSNYGARSVDIGAPGTNIRSTEPGGGYRFADGTSMATPHVSGAAAVVASLHPTASDVGLKAVLMDRVDPRTSLASTVKSGGRLNVDAAARCTGAEALVESPGPGFEADVDQPLTVTAVGTACGDPAGVTVAATVNGTPVDLTPRGDGLLAGTYTPTASGALTISVTASAGAATDTHSVSGTAVRTYAIQPGGAPVTVTTTSAGENAEARFDGVAGRRVALRLSSVTMGTSTCCGAKVSILKPDGSSLVLPTFFGTQGAFVDTKTLPTTGVYTIFVDPQSSATGSATLTLYDVPPDTTGPIIAGNGATGVAVGTPGQNARLTFDGTAGSRRSVRLTSVAMGTSTCCGIKVSVVNPSGSTLITPTYVGTQGGFIDVKTLGQTGTYTILVDPQTTVTGTANVTLYDVPPDAGGTMTPGGPTLTVTTTVPGQNARPVFAGAAGQRISLRITGVTIGSSTCCSAQVSIVRPDGVTLVSATSFGTNGGYVDVKTLPLTGTYTILVDPQSTSVGSATLKLHDVPADVTGAVTIGGSGLTIGIGTPGQKARITFSGAAGQAVTLYLTGVTIGSSTCCSARVSIVRPEGTNLVAPSIFGRNGKTLSTTLPVAGTYAIVIDPEDAATGLVTVRVA